MSDPYGARPEGPDDESRAQPPPVNPHPVEPPEAYPPQLGHPRQPDYPQGFGQPFGSPGAQPGGPYGYGGPGQVLQPPPVIRTLVGFMVTGGVLTVLATLVGLVGIEREIQDALQQAGSTTAPEAAQLGEAVVPFVIGLAVVAALVGAGLWFLFAWLFARGSGRTLGTVLGGINGAFTLFGLLGTQDLVDLALGVLQLAVVVAALVLLWRPHTSAWFAAVKASRQTG